MAIALIVLVIIAIGWICLLVNVGADSLDHNDLYGMDPEDYLREQMGEKEYLKYTQNKK